MSLIAKIKGIEGYRKYLKMLVLSTALAFGMLYIAFGLMFFANRGNPVPAHFILLIAAVFFVIFTVFYESKEREREKGKGKRKGKEGLKSLIKGLFLAICATFAFVAIVGGVIFMIGGVYLFSIDAELEEELNKCVIPERLENIFETNGIPLSENITIMKENSDKWEITDEENKAYIIRKENRELNVYGGGIEEIGGIEAFISALAICMIVSMVFLSLLKPFSR